MRRLLSLAALSILTLSASASAQRSGSTANPSPEIGMDAAITFGLGTGQGTLVDIPAQSIRMGFFVSPVLSIEPMFGLRSASGGGTTVTVYNIGAGALYHFSPNRAANQFYVRPFIQIAGFSGGGTSDSQALFGVGGGLKIPLRDRISSRFEANFSHTDGSDMIGLLAGLSFYTR
jgi:hypothetical protein